MKLAVANPEFKVHCLRIVPLWGPTVYLTDHVRDLVIGADTYKTDSGYQFTGLATEASMSPGVLDLSGIAGIAGIKYDTVASGVFDNARVYAFATTWRTPIVDEEPIGFAFLGKTKLQDDRYTIEMMMAVDALNQSTGHTYTPTCQKKFGGQEFAGCKKVLNVITVTGTITAVTSSAVFRDSARTEVADYFGEGTTAFTTGLNAGLKPLEVKAYVGVNSKSVTAITQAASAVVTVGAHTFVVGDVLAFSGVVGMVEINGLTGTVTVISDTGVTVNINSTAFTAYVSGGVTATLAGGITLHQPCPYPVSIGDAYTLIPGCRKRVEDCGAKWSNIVNFGGFSFVPTQSTYSKVGLK